MRVNVGKLNKRIQIQRPVRTADKDGFWTETYETVLTCWAQFSRQSGKELTQASADYAEVAARFMIRYTTVPIDRKMCVLYAGKRYAIQYVNDYADNHDLMEILAKLETTEAIV